MIAKHTLDWFCE